MAAGHRPDLLGVRRANRIVRLDEHDQPVTFLGDLLNPLGMTVDAQGRLISLQTQTGFTGARVVWPTGREKIVADNYQGRPFGRPNDIIADLKGGVYFTDLPNRRPSRPTCPPRCTTSRLAARRSAWQRISVVRTACSSARDEKTFYVDDTAGIHAYAFDVQPDGRLTNRRVFATYVGRTTASPTAPPASNADGLTIDDEGRLYALTEAGIEVVSPDRAARRDHLRSGASRGAARTWRSAAPTSGRSTWPVAARCFRIPMLARGFGGRVK